VDRPRWFIRLALTLAIAGTLPGGRTEALVVEGGATVNTTSSGFNSVFYNVGLVVGHGSTVYLGDGWALTAQHVTVQTPTAQLTFDFPGGSSQSYSVVNQIDLPGSQSDVDLKLVQLAQAPPLPSIFQNISTSSPTAGSVVAMVGGGYNSGGGPLYWNDANNLSGPLALGSSSGSPISGTPNPIPSDTYWTSKNNSVPAGTYQDAGFAWGGNGLVQWGESVVSANNVTANINGQYVSQTFVTTFYNSTYDPPSTPAWATKVAAIGSNMAQVATGDSGGGVFTQSGSAWNLSGILVYLNDIGSDRNVNPTPANAAYGDLSYAIDLSQYASSIQNIINSTATWTGQTNGNWDNSTSNWSNAANNAAAIFSASGNAKFADTNPQFKIPLNPSISSSLPAGVPSLVGMQSVAIQSAGISASSVTFTNTGSANGGVDYVLSNASGNVGISGNVSLDLSGNGNGVGGAVYLTGANTFTGQVQVFVGRLNLQNSLALGNSANDAVFTGAALELQTTSGTPTFGLTSGSTGIALTLNGSGIAGTGALDNISGNNTYAGPISLATPGSAAVTIGATAGQFSLTGGVNMFGNALTFTGPGNTSISGAAFTSVNGATQYPGGTVTKMGSGTLTLNFAGSGSPASNLLMPTSPLAVGGGELLINGATNGAGSSQTVANLSVNSGSTAIVDTSNGVSSNFIVTSSTINRAVGGTVDFTPPTVGSISFTTPPNVTGGIIGGWATVGGSSWATLSGNNLAPYSSATQVNTAAVFTNTTNYDVTGSVLAASGAANSLRFLNGATPAIVTLAGSVSIATGGVLVPSSVTSADTITGGTLQGASGADLVIIQNSASPLTISSVIADNGSPTGLTKSGSGALTLTVANSYTGVTTLNSGTLNINNNTAIGSGALVINGGTLDNTSGASVSITNAETWNGSFLFQGTNALSQTTGAITLTASPTITLASNAGALNIGGNIGGSFGLTLASPTTSSTLVLSGNNTFTGGMTIDGGTLQIGTSGTNGGSALNGSDPNVVSFGSVGTLNLNGNSVSVGGLSSTLTSSASIEASAASASATLTINGIGNYNFTGSVTNGGTGSLSLVKSGSGTQILSGTNSYTGSTTVNAGVLQFNADAEVPSLSTGGITINGAGTVAAGSAIDQTFLTDAHITSGSTGTVALAFNSGNPLSLAGLGVSLGSTGDYTYTGTLTPNGTNYNLGGGGGLLTFSGPLSGAKSLTVLNGGDVALTAANSYSGGTIINSGTTLLISADTAAVGSGSTAQLGQVPSTAATNITINGGTLQSTSTFTLNANRGIALGTSGGSIDVDGLSSPSAPNTLTYNGVIAGSGSLTLTDTGTLVLGGVNQYGGATNLNSGTLRAGIANTIPQTSAVALGLGGTLQLNGFSQSIGSLTGGGIVTDNSSTSASLTVGNDNTSPAAFYGVLSDTSASNTGTLALNKVGGGTMTLTGLNTYSGGTTVNDGILATVGGGTLGPGSLRINSANGPFSSVSIGTTQSVSSLTNSMSGAGLTVLTVASGTTLTSTGSLTNTGTLTVGATGGRYAGTLVVDGAPTLNANSSLQLTAGILQFNVTNGTATIQSGVTATVAAGATLQLAGTVSALSNGSALNPTNGQAVNITNNGSTASGGGLSVIGTNQSVGTIAGAGTTSGGATVYSGDTVVGAGASLTASEILQNTLTIGAGATVTIRPSGPGTVTSPSASDATASDTESTSAAPASATSLEIQRIQNRIAILEQLETSESNSTLSPLDETPPSALASATGIANPATASLTSDIDPTVLTSEIANLLSVENSLLASEDSSSGNGAGADFFSPAGSSAAGAAVPEPPGLLLALIAVGFAAALAACRVSGSKIVD
jgi:fibronectin-binding autotransporter adhesin